MLKKAICWALLGILAGVIVVAGYTAFQLDVSRPKRNGEVRVTGLSAPVIVRFDSFGVAEIKAKNRLDASLGLGYVTAGDRLFQMDLIRRKSSGRLAEIFGEATLESDIRQRHFDFERTARKIVDALPSKHRQVLEFYAEGVNAYIEQTDSLPPEFLLLQYQPAKWTTLDSMLVILSMFQILAWTETEERMMSIMDECLPKSVNLFLTPDTDQYTSVITGGPKSARPVRPIPVADIATVLQKNQDLSASVNIDPTGEQAGSNNWAVNRTKTADGSAMVANDMHLPITVPNIWYRADLHYQGLRVGGLNLPGTPAIVAGSNDHVAWGFTNFMADVMDLVKLEIHPNNPDKYLSKEGWRNFGIVSHSIQVKGRESVTLKVRVSRWGPVLPDLLLGKPVAYHWTATDPTAVDLGLMDMDGAASISEGLSILSKAGGPPQNALLADDKGNIAWTIMGRFPRRTGDFDGSVSRRWDDQTVGWDGYLNPERLPRIINPPSGILATANNRNIGGDFPNILGRNYAHGYRTFRIRERLNALKNLTEKDLFQLQLDTKTDFYRYYQSLVSSLLNRQDTTNNPLLTDIQREVDAWDGFARAESRGLPLLTSFRAELAKSVFGPILKACSARDKTFKYRWFKMETPLRQLLDKKITETLPDARFKSWDDFLVSALEKSTLELKRRHSLETLKNFTWGQYREIRITHPLSSGLPWLSSLLDMPTRDYGGCSFCVRVISQGLSASERFVISPGRTERGILHMPGGQSGHFLSPHYDDQHVYWATGQPLHYRSGRAETVLRLVP